MLTLSRLIIDTHDDYDPWADIVVGFTDDREFVIRFEYKDYDDRSRDYLLSAYIDFDNAIRLSRQLRISLLELPDCIEKEFGGPLDRCTAGEVKDTFDEILDFIGSYRIRYRIRKEKRQDPER